LGSLLIGVGLYRVHLRLLFEESIGTDCERPVGILAGMSRRTRPQCEDAPGCPRPVDYRVTVKLNDGTTKTLRVCTYHKSGWEAAGGLISFERI
jgi:hypothetical protein